MSATILLTRVEEKNQVFLNELTDVGYTILSKPLLLPLILELTATMKQRILTLDRYDGIVFISVNAVRFGMPRLEDFWPQWPLPLRWYAIGPATKKQLSDWDIQAKTPFHASSEGLLAEPDFLQVRGQKFLIVRGATGRDTLKVELIRRSAHVDYLEVYNRLPIAYSKDEFNQFDMPVIALIYSGEDLLRFKTLIGDKTTSYHLIVPSTRLKTMAFHLGFAKVELAVSQEDNAMLHTLAAMLNHL